jgi:trans-L-3-hydroxyproline dehydratase
VVRAYKTIDAHVGGQPLRLVVDGMRRIAGKSLLQKRTWLREHGDGVRRAVVLEPRGHAGIVAAALTEPESPQAHAGLLFMDCDGYPLMSGHGVIAATTLAIERELLFTRDAAEGENVVVFETPAGIVHSRARLASHGGVRRVDSVAFANVPSFVHSAGRAVRTGARELRVDLAFGGVFYAIADAESIGIPLRSERLPDLRRLGLAITASLNASGPVVHPAEPAFGGVAGVVFTGPPEDPEAHLRSVTVTGGSIDRSPGGTATAAVMAVLDAMGLLADEQIFVHESLTGAIFRGRALRRTVVGDLPALVPEIEGSAWITGEQTLLVDEDDPLHDGFCF